MTRDISYSQMLQFLWNRLKILPITTTTTTTTTKHLNGAETLIIADKELSKWTMLTYLSTRKNKYHTMHFLHTKSATCQFHTQCIMK
jgi:hypothetical protein